jgi:hypothetical protein
MTNKGYQQNSERNNKKHYPSNSDVKGDFNGNSTIIFTEFKNFQLNFTNMLC